MQSAKPNPRRAEPPFAMVEVVRGLIRSLGVQGAARRMNLGREATLAIAAGARVDKGTLALAERALEI